MRPINLSQVDPLPHQLDAVYTHLLTQPRIRFLIADDPGAGKTIMGGLLLKELKFRGLIERTLIVTPASLTDQWRREMQDKFHETFTVINRHTINASRGTKGSGRSAGCRPTCGASPRPRSGDTARWTSPTPS